MAVGEDRISELYDALIHHIFSFLPIKCVVATSALSKRWKNLWIFAPIIEIHQWRRSILNYNKTLGQEDTSRLVNFLDKMLRLPSRSEVNGIMPNFKKFHLKYCCYDPEEDNLFDKRKVLGWITNLIVRKVEELGFCLGQNFILPSCLFTCETLTMLKIEMAGDLSATIKKVGTLRQASSIYFPRLKILHLTHMVFVDENLSAKLFSNCPVLEELMLTDCYMMKKKVLCISVASLKRLSIIANSKIYSCKLKIDTPNIQSLTYEGMPEDNVLTDHGFSSLVNADINITSPTVGKGTKRGKERQSGIENLLLGISNITNLCISGSTIEALCYEGPFILTPIFHDLKRLEVSTKLSCLMSMGFIRLLSTLPNLESVVIIIDLCTHLLLYYYDNLPDITLVFGSRHYIIYKLVTSYCLFYTLKSEYDINLKCGGKYGERGLGFFPKETGVLGFSIFDSYLTSDRRMVPECLLRQLKVVEVREFSGDQKVLDFIHYFLKNSLVLQTMEITFSSSTSQHLWDSLMKEILRFPKALLVV
ncbi:hypothetical protein MKW92_036171 [Papaver armeniacum]|nr:hypothetical protein MKW92_036171 [Papaver armeniacum]